MLDKYTIFDNFDKLDLSPVAGRFDNFLSIAPSPDELITLDSDSIPQNVTEMLNKTSFIKANETIYTSLGDARYLQQIEPYNITPQNFGSFGTYTPDLFRYITGKRFYIDNNLKIKHTNTGLNNDGTFLYLNNLFVLDFYFQFADFTSLNRQFINNNFLYSKVRQDNSLQNFISLQTFLEGVTPGVDFQGLLDPSSNGITNPFLEGTNKILFQYDKETNSLKPLDAIPVPGSPTQIKYLAVDTAKSVVYLNSLLVLLQRLLYPISTNPNTIPRHIYFVTDLKKSVNTELVADVLPYANYDYVKVNSSYNYYKPYAEDFSPNVTTEWQLPNAYTYYSFLSSKKQNKLSKYYSELVKVTPVGSNTQELGEDMTLEKYYNFSNASSDPSQFQSFNLTGEAAENFLYVYRNRNISFGKNVENITKEVDAIKNIFPYYNKIELPAVNSTFMHKLQQQNFLDSFMSLVGNYFGDRAVDVFGKSIPGGIDYRKGALHTFSGFSTEAGDSEETNLFASTMQVLDISSLSSQLSKYKNYLFDNSLVKFASNSVMLPEKQEDSVLSDYNISALNDVIKDYCKNKTLSYEAIENGDKCYSEMLGFEIVKSSVADGGKTILQSFFIPCIGEDPMSYIDTQVFYEKEYIYEVYSISLIVGTEYTSELGRVNNTSIPQIITPEGELPEGFFIPGGFEGQTPEFITEGQPEFSLNEKTLELQLTEFDPLLGPKDFKIKLPPKEFPVGGVPKPIIVRAPYYNNVSFGTQKTTKLLDKPPLPPEISFYPYKDIDNKVLILLNVNYGERKLFPVQVFSGDAGQILKYYESQLELDIDKGSYKKRVLYRTDDFLGTYKVYRIDNMPISWSDFVDEPIAEISNSQNSGFEDNILPNVDYYYFARFEDVHGNFSNPTEIFKLRMVKEGGFPPYMILKVYTFSEARKGLVREKSFKKYLKIRLADGVRKYLNTTDINKTDIGYTKEILNPEFKSRRALSEQIKKYKVRITSKQTGKKIDINLDFKKNISEKYLSKEIETEKQSLAIDLIDKEKNKMESKANFINTDNMASQYDEKTKDFASTDDVLLQTDTTISFIDKQN